jgi:hypothetical protein
MILLVGCGARVQIGSDLPDADKPSSDSAVMTGMGGASGDGGNGPAAGSAGIAGSGGVAGASTTGGAGGTGAIAGADGSGGGGGASGDGGTSGGMGGATSGAGGTTGTGGDGGASGMGGMGAGGSAGSAGAAGTGGSGPRADAGPLPPWPTPTQCPPAGSSPLVGEWVGHIENYAFPSGSNLVHLFIEGADDTSFCGSVIFGAGPLPPPATNPDVGYPPGADIQNLHFTPAWNAPYEGFNYRLMNAAVSGNDIRYGVYTYELWNSWCVLQTSYLTERGDFRCITNGIGEKSSEAGTDGGAECAIVDSSNRTVVDCDKLVLCGGPSVFDAVCECNAAGCMAHSFNTRELGARVDGNVMTGNVRIDSSGLAYRVELVRN